MTNIVNRRTCINILVKRKVTDIRKHTLKQYLQGKRVAKTPKGQVLKKAEYLEKFF